MIKTPLLEMIIAVEFELIVLFVITIESTLLDSIAQLLLVITLPVISDDPDTLIPLSCVNDNMLFTTSAKDIFGPLLQPSATAGRAV